MVVKQQLQQTKHKKNKFSCIFSHSVTLVSTSFVFVTIIKTKTVKTKSQKIAIKIAIKKTQLIDNKTKKTQFEKHNKTLK